MSKQEPTPPAAKRAGRAVTVTVSLSTLIGGIMALSAGFVLVFALGILLGRGHNVEAGIPELERIMPQPGPTQAPVVISGDSPAPPAGNGTAAGNGRGILQQSELEYRDNLKPGASSPRRETPPTPRAPAAGREKPPAQPAADTARATPPPAQTAAPQASGDTQTYHYVYQAAAYKDQPSCDAFVARLQKAGFKARTVKEAGENTTWYKTFIDFTGKPDDTDALREKLKSNGIPRVILKSKTPVKPS